MDFYHKKHMAFRRLGGVTRQHFVGRVEGINGFFNKKCVPEPKIHTPPLFEVKLDQGWAFFVVALAFAGRRCAFACGRATTRSSALTNNNAFLGKRLQSLSNYAIMTLTGKASQHNKGEEKNDFLAMALWRNLQSL
jgi:hypothetical protein